MQSSRELTLVAGESMRDSQVEELVALVSSYSRFLYRVAFTVVKNHHDAEDIVQETFLRVMKHLDVLPSVRSRRAWLGSIAWRLALNKVRSPRKSGLDEAHVVPRLLDRAASPEDAASSRQMFDIVDRLVNSLPADLREALLLSLIEGMTSAEIGQILEIPDSTVRNRVYRARKMLQEKLETFSGGQND